MRERICDEEKAEALCKAVGEEHGEPLHHHAAAIRQGGERRDQKEEGVDVPREVRDLLVRHQPSQLRVEQRGREDLHGAHAGVQPAQVGRGEVEAVVVGGVDEPDGVESVLSPLDRSVHAYIAEGRRDYRR